LEEIQILEDQEDIPEVLRTTPITMGEMVEAVELISMKKI